MAGAGFKTWVDGDILTAADVNTYLMEQAVMVFADASARTTALTAPSEGMITFLKDSNKLEYYDGAAWQPMVDQDVIAAKGDLIVGTGDDAVSRLAVGTNGQVLTADSTETTGLKWANASASGLVKISNATPSAAASVSFNNVFTSTYRNYLVIFDGTASAGSVLFFRLRASGSDISLTNYSYQRLEADSTSIQASRLTSQAQARVGYADTSHDGLAFYVFDPELSVPTTMKTFQGYFGGGTDVRIDEFTCAYSASTSVDGFTFYPQTGTITGTITVYGFEV